MADLSKIKLNGTEYNLKDAIAREELSYKADIYDITSGVGSSGSSSNFYIYLSNYYGNYEYTNFMIFVNKTQQIDSSFQIRTLTNNNYLEIPSSRLTINGVNNPRYIEPGLYQGTMSAWSKNADITLVSVLNSTQLQALLSDYQTTAQVNSAIATAIGNINQFEVTIVIDLPTTNIDTHTIYFKSNSSSGDNVYDEYMYINNNWELIGSTAIDLTSYALKTEIPTLEPMTNVETMLTSFGLNASANLTQAQTGTAETDHAVAG